MLKSLKKSVHLIVALLCSVTLFLAGAFIAPKPLEAMADTQPDSSFTKISFSNFGIADGTYDYNNGEYAAVGTLSDTFDKKFFSGTVKFSGNGVNLYLAGTKAGKGISFALAGAAMSINIDGTRIQNMTAAKAGTTLRNAEFLLGLTVEYADTDSDGAKDDLKLGVYFNGKLYDGKFITVANSAAKLGDVASIKCNTNGTTLEVKGDKDVNRIPDKTLNWLTTTHFYIEDGTYGYNNGNVAVKGSYPLNLKNSYFTANVTFSANEGVGIRYAGNETDGGLTGLLFRLSGGKLLLEEALGKSNFVYEFTAEDAGLTAFADTAFKLGISLENIDADSDGNTDDVRLGVWFNDILYKEEFIYLIDYASVFGNTIGVLSKVEGSTVKIEAISELSINMPDPSLKKITFEHFDIANGSYAGAHPALSIKGTYNKGIENTYFSGSLTYTGSPVLIFGADESGWVGIGLSVKSEKLEMYYTYDSAPIATFISSTAGLKDFSKKFRIGISTQIVDNDGDGNKNDVKLGVYFNENLYNNDYIYLKDYADTLGDTISIYGTSGQRLHVESVAEFKEPVTSRPLDSSFDKITFETVAIDDGRYEFNAQALSAAGSYAKSFDGTAFSGNVKYNVAANGSAQIIFGATAGGWAGLTFAVTSDDRMIVSNNQGHSGQYAFIASKAGIESFIETAFDLGISTRCVDSDSDGKKDDVELGVWFNDVLYNDSFIYIVDYAEWLGKDVSIYCPEKAWIEIKSRADFIPVIVPEELDSGFKTITLNDFAIASKLYESNGSLVAAGNYLKSLHNTYFVFYAKFNIPDDSTAVSFQYAGPGDGWTGMAMEVSENKITIGDNSGFGRSDRYIYSAKQANLDSFVNKKLKFGVSTQYMDLDGDGAEDDVRFGLWINDVLCKNEYMDVIDYRQYVGNSQIGGGLGIYIRPSEKKSATVELSSVKIPVRFEQFGVSSNWAKDLSIFASTSTTNPSDTTTQSPQTGEEGKLLNAMIFSCVALGGIINIENKSKIRH